MAHRRQIFRGGNDARFLPLNDRPLSAYHPLCPGPQTKFVYSSSQTLRDSVHVIMPNQQEQVTPEVHPALIRTPNNSLE
jgi:hypothetical protein